MEEKEDFHALPRASEDLSKRRVEVLLRLCDIWSVA